MLDKNFRILIVKIGAIGDVVMSLPLLQELRNIYPKAHITWICGSIVQPLLKETNLIDQIIAVDETKLLAGAFLTKIGQLFRIWRQIGLKYYDAVFNLHPDPRYRLISLFCRYKDHKHIGNISNHRYHASEYLHLLQRANGPLTVNTTFPTIRPVLKLQLPNREVKPIVVAPGGAKNVLANDALRRWPIQHYAQLIHDLAILHHPIVITGSASDKWVLEYLPEGSFHSVIGQLDLLELVALLQQSALLITHDSGPLHLAKLAKCPTIGLFGPTLPASRVGTSESHIKVIWGGQHLACRPCYNGKTFARCSNNECLSSIHPTQVLQAVHDLLPKKTVDLPQSPIYHV